MKYRSGLLLLFLLCLVGALCWRMNQSPRARQGWQPLGVQHRIDLNRADADTLAMLPGLGPQRARRIVAYRRYHGRFRTPAEILRVRGVGPRTLEGLLPYVRIGRSDERTDPGSLRVSSQQMK